MRRLFGIFAALALLTSGLLLPAAPACAQFVKADATKTPSKFTIWAQTMKGKCEKTMESIQNSGFGQFVGDAVKYTKEGIKYAKDMYEKGMDLYNQTKDKVLNSPEYKMAMISKEIAEESAELKKIQEQKLEKQKSIEAEIELLKEQTAAKIAAAQQNIQVLEQEVQQKNADAASSDQISAQESVEAEIEQIQASLDLELSDLEGQLDEINEEFQEKIIKQGEKIAKLTKELSEVASTTKKKKKTKDPKEALKKNQSSFFTTDKPSIRVQNKIKEQRQEAMSDAGTEALVMKSEKKMNRSADVDKVETKEDLADTMPGESEGSGVSAEVLGEQMNILLSYITLMATDLKLQASIEVASFNKANSTPLKETFNLCDYTDPENVGLEGAKKKVSKVTDVAKSAYQKYNAAQQKIADAKDKVNEVKSKVEQAKETVSQVQDLAEQAKGVNINADAATAFIGN